MRLTDCGPDSWQQIRMVGALLPLVQKGPMVLMSGCPIPRLSGRITMRDNSTTVVQVKKYHRLQHIRNSLQSVKEAAVRLQVLLSRTTPPRRGSRGTPRRGGRTNHRGGRGRLPNKYKIQMVTVTKVMVGGSRPGRRLRKWLREHGRSRTQIGGFNHGIGGMVGGSEGQMMPVPNGMTAQDLDGHMTETVTLTHRSGMASQFHCSRTSVKLKSGKPRRRWIRHVVDLVCSAD